MFRHFQAAALICIFLLIANGTKSTVSVVNQEKYSIAKDRRYLLYEVNPGEGMNLRRDVYMRVAEVLRHLRGAGENFVLVLPPWGHSAHWQSQELAFQEKVPWKLWFDLESLNRFVPVIELTEFMHETGAQSIDAVYYLQHFVEGWTKWEEKYEFRPCVKHFYYEETPGHWKFWFWGYDEIYAKNFTCISFQGHSKLAAKLIADSIPAGLRSVMVDRSEVMLHDNFGDKAYWECRRSMRYSAEVRAVADEFRAANLSSTDESDKTLLSDDWTQMRVKAGQAIGGPYMAVHLRRRDFVTTQRSFTPSIEGAIAQIVERAEQVNLSTVYVATDGSKKEIQELFAGLQLHGLKPIRFLPSREVLHTFLEGGIAIIEQWICAHARYFIGSGESTYSLRIFEDREILGFHPSSTHNSFCSDNEPNCEQPAKWTLVQ